MKQLKFGTVRFMQARTELIESRLIAYRHPLYQVLALGAGSAQKPDRVGESGPKSTPCPVAIKEILQQLCVARHSHD